MSKEDDMEHQMLEDLGAFEVMGGVERIVGLDISMKVEEAPRVEVATPQSWDSVETKGERREHGVR